MATLSTDTGGKAFFDSNDFAPAFAQVQNDTSAYYAIGFHSIESRARRQVSQADGQDRPARRQARIPARLLRAGRLQALRQGRPRAGTRGSACQRSAGHRHGRLHGRHVLPPRREPFLHAGFAGRAGLADSVREGRRQGQGHARHHRRGDRRGASAPWAACAIPSSSISIPSLQARQKNIQYTTSFNLPPGKYQLKFVVRENQTGRMGSFIADVTLPDLKKAPLKMSSIVLASQRDAEQEGRIRWCATARSTCPTSATSSARTSTSICSTRSTIRHAKRRRRTRRRRPSPGINLLSSLELIQGSTKVYETPMVQAKAINVDGRDAVAVELDVPLSGLKPGQYICQLNVIDDAAGSFAFPRFAVLVREPASRRLRLPLFSATAQPAAGPSSRPKQTAVSLAPSADRRGRVPLCLCRADQDFFPVINGIGTTIRIAPRTAKRSACVRSIRRAPNPR